MQVSQVPAPQPPEIPEWLFQRGPDPMEIAIAVVLVLASAGALSMLWMIVRGMVRRWSLPQAADDTVEGLRRSVQQLSAEVGELHERMDFAERMLAARREPQRLDERGG